MPVGVEFFVLLTLWVTFAPWKNRDFRRAPGIMRL